MPQKTFALSAKAVVRDDRGRCLIVRRSAGSKNNSGLWDFPGGKVNPGEPFDAALVREVHEETGLAVELEKTLGAAQSELPERVVVYLFLQARPSSGEVLLSEEHDRHAWVTPAELAETAMCPQLMGFAREWAVGAGLELAKPSPDQGVRTALSNNTLSDND